MLALGNGIPQNKESGVFQVDTIQVFSDLSPLEALLDFFFLASKLVSIGYIQKVGETQLKQFLSPGEPDLPQAVKDDNVKAVRKRRKHWLNHD